MARPATPRPVTYGIVLVLGCLFAVRPVSAATCSPTGSNGYYTITTSCNFANAVDGVDYATGATANDPNSSTLEIAAGVSLRLETAALAPQTLVLGKLKLNSGSSLIIPAGSKFELGTALFVKDTDGDGYGDTTTYTSKRATTYAGYVRKLAMTGVDTNDTQKCADSDTPSTAGSAMYGTTCKRCSGGGLTNAASGTDPNNQCAPVSCGSYAWGWGGSGSLTCLQATTNATANGMCNGAGACNSSVASACQASGTGMAVGSAGCKAACSQGDAWTSRDTLAEIGYTDSLQHGCGAGTICNASATCVAGGLHCWGTVAGSCNAACNDDGSNSYTAGECFFSCANGASCDPDGAGSCFTLTTGTYYACSLYDQYYPYDCMACDGGVAGTCAVTGTRCVWNP